MHSIGEISKIVNISVDALRHYDEIGLLKPCHINETNRYRYYSKEQISDLMFILEMKAYGFSLDAIRELLLSGDPARIESALGSRLKELKMEQDNIQKNIQHLQRRLDKSKAETTVLIVDDAPFMRMTLSDILGKRGYAVVGEASTGEEGIRMFSQLNPDLVIMDIHMPQGLDGIQAAKEITEISKEAKVIMCSARGNLENVLRSIESGAQAFVLKPFQAEGLLDGMTELLENEWNPVTGLVSRWLSDSNVTDKFSEEPLSQGAINQAFQLCSGNEPDSDERLRELLAEI